MKKVLISVVASVVTTMALGTAHATGNAYVVMGATCEKSNLLSRTESQETVICADGKWVALTPAMASIEVKKYDVAKKLEASSVITSIVGARSTQQSGAFKMVATVVAINPDNTAQVVIDIDDAGWEKRVDATVPLDEALAIGPNTSGAEYQLTIKHKPV